MNESTTTEVEGLIANKSKEALAIMVVMLRRQLYRCVLDAAESEASATRRADLLQSRGQDPENPRRIALMYSKLAQRCKEVLQLTKV